MTLKLYPFQEEGVRFLMNRDRALLADEPGLGKTVQAIMAAKGFNSVLIICPRAVTHFWKNEIVRWADVAPEEIAVYTSTNRHDESFFNQPGVRFYIIYWPVVRLHKPALFGRNWDVVIADEAHKLKGRNTQQSKTVRQIYSHKRYALTGTPIVNRTSDIWGILNFLDRNKFRSFWRFFNEYVHAVKQPFGGYAEYGPRDEKAFRKLMSPYTLRRLKKKVLKELPDKTYTVLPVDLSDAQRKAYNDLRKTMWTQIDQQVVVAAQNALVLLTRLRQVACGLHLLSPTSTVSSKLDAAAELVENRGADSTAVFSQFVGMVTGLRDRLEKKGIRCGVITGKECSVDGVALERGELVELFQLGEFPVIVMTMQTSGEGITLHRADTTIFLDESWSPAQQTQAEDRIHRVGQTRPVQIITLVARDTVESRVRALLSRKRALLRRLFDVGDPKKLLKELL